MVVGVLASYMTGDIVIQHHTIIQTSHTFSMYGGGDIQPPQSNHQNVELGGSVSVTLSQ